MGTASHSIDIAADPAKVWELVGDFHGLPRWNAGLAESRSEDGGKVRYLVRRAGGHVRERLIARDDAKRTITYAIFESGLPIGRHVATMQVVGKGMESKVNWSCEFESTGPPEAEVVAIFKQIFTGGLSNLKAMLENGT